MPGPRHHFAKVGPPDAARDPERTPQRRQARAHPKPRDPKGHGATGADSPRHLPKMPEPNDPKAAAHASLPRSLPPCQRAQHDREQAPCSKPKFEELRAAARPLRPRAAIARTAYVGPVSNRIKPFRDRNRNLLPIRQFGDD